MANFSQMARTMAAECPAFRVRQASRVLGKLFDDALRPLGLFLSQLPVLAALAMFGEAGATMSALAQVLVMDRTTLTRNVRPLEKAGLIRVARSPDDGRTRIVLLTRKGERMIQAVFPLWEGVVTHIRATVGADVMADLHAKLDEVIAMSEPANVPGDVRANRVRATARGAMP